MDRVADNQMVYSYIKRLMAGFDTTPDSKGDSSGKFNILVAHFRKILARVPDEDSKIATMAAAILLLKEDELPLDADLQEVLLAEQIEQTAMIMEQELPTDSLLEDAPSNMAGGGNIAGIGVGPDGEPGVSKKAHKKIKKRNQEGLPSTSLLTRKRT